MVKTTKRQGKVVSVEVKLDTKGRRTIHVHLDDGRIIKNNWDWWVNTKRRFPYDLKFDKRMLSAANSLGKDIGWSTYGCDNPDEWFDEIF